MIPRMKTAGTAGVVAGIALAIGFVLFLTSGMTPAILGDPAQALDRFGKSGAYLRLISALFVIAVAFAVVFITGFAARLRERTPTRAAATLYFGILGLAGHGLGALIFLTAIPAVVAYAAKDQVAASHAWVALYALDGATDGLGTLFAGLAFLMAGWAIVATKVLSTALGWVAIIAGVIGVITVLAPQSEVLFFASFVLPIVVLVWAGSALRATT